MNRKRDQMQFSIENWLEKRKNCYKIVELIHQFYKKNFHLSQNVYHGTEKNCVGWDNKVKRMGSSCCDPPPRSIAKTGSNSYYILAIISVRDSAMCVWWQDRFKIKMSKKTHCIYGDMMSDYLVYFLKISICPTWLQMP